MKINPFMFFMKNHANKHYHTTIVFIFLMLLNPSKVVSQPSNNTSPPPPSSDFPSPGRYQFSPGMSAAFVIVVVVFFMVGCFSVFGRQCFDSSRERSGLVTINGGNRRSGRTMHGLEPNLIDTFPIYLYSDVKKVKIGSQGALECAICLNEFKDDEALRMLPKCCHVFHPECIDTWLISHVTCPVCRANLAVTEMETPGTGTNNFDLLSRHASEDATTRSPNNDEGHGHIHEISETRIELGDLTNERQNVVGKFPRSHSTGHSFIQPGNDYERFTLRLPQDVQKKLIKPDLRRAKSNLVFPSESSTKKGFRSSSAGAGLHNNYNSYDERFDHESRRERWGFTTAPPFFTRSRSFQTPIGSSSKDEVGERSFVKLMGNSPV